MTLDKLRLVTLINSKLSMGEMQSNAVGEERYQLYTFFRKSVLDSRIPVIKPIGFLVENSEGIKNNSAVERHTQSLLNNMELSRRISSLVFYGRCAEIIDINNIKNLESTNFVFKNAENELYCLNDNVQIIKTVFSNVSLKMVMIKDSGIRTIETNAKYLATNKLFNFMFPMDTYHSLANLVQIKPYIKERIQYSCNFEHMPNIWEDYIKRLVTSWNDYMDKIEWSEFLEGVLNEKIKV